MVRLPFGLLVLALFGSTTSPTNRLAWPHRALVSSPDGHPVAFRAYTLGGGLIVAVDAAGRHTLRPQAVSRLRALTRQDTVRATTPADFPLDLTHGPVVFVAEGTDSLRLVVGWNPHGSIRQVRAIGRELTVRLRAEQIAVDAR